MVKFRVLMISSLRSLSRTLLLFAAAAVPCAATSASADVLYDVTTNAFGVTTHETFTTPTLVTSTASFTSFLINTSTGSAVNTLVLSPASPGTCSVGVISGAAPCLGLAFANGNTTAIFGFQTFTTYGIYNIGSATITISPFASAVPEPSSLALAFTGVVLTSAFVFRRAFSG